MTPRTRLLFLSHITSATALVFPLAELCARARKAGILTLIDGAHAPGQLELDLDRLGADFYTGNCHKWLCAPKGTAFLHARPESQGLLHAPVVSWGYSVSDDAHAGYTGETEFERRMQWQGTRDVAAFLTVPAAIAFQERRSWPDIRRRCHAMAVEMLHDVSDRFGTERPCSDEDFVQMVCLPVPARDPESLRATLFEKHHIEVPVTTHGGRTFVRISVQGYNTEDDLHRLKQALDMVISN